MKSPTAKTLAYLRKHGVTCQVVEQWVKTKDGGFRRDLFNCIDVVAIAGCDTIGIQATSGDNHAARLTKSLAIPELILWLQAGNKFLIFSWRKNSKNRWVPRADQIFYNALILNVKPFPLKTSANRK